MKLDDLLKQWKSDSLSAETRDSVAREILESAQSSIGGGEYSPELLHEFLNMTGRPEFLRSLCSRERRYAWSDTAFKAIDKSNYTLLDMFRYTRSRDPEKTLFQDMSEPNPGLWSYQVVEQRVKTIAALFHKTDSRPRVAIFSENHIESALADLACLFYDILVTPLNVHFDFDTLRHIFEKLEITIAVTDTFENYNLLCQLRDSTRMKFRIFTVKTLENYRLQDESLSEASLEIAGNEVERILSGRKRIGLHEVCTVMFTSGSTGQPKGISFSHYALVTKRFARAAALPNVGDDEVLLCYLPLYHTFGRYFEMLGVIYWGGTYVFPGDPSVETLIRQLKEVNPSGLISIPLRWLQIYEQCLQEMSTVPSADEKEAKYRGVVGGRLHWGLSAAGHLAPKVFKFFNDHGVKLCSGFGMTEATGGITMTPPGEYVENSIGIPLPGVEAKFSPEGELSIRGPYIARYLDVAGPGDIISEDDNYYLPTGDLFRELENGHYEIIDRLKDIYKNNKGQTIAPLKVEQKFQGVPGINRTFLVGDAREYNVLLIVPDFEDETYKGFKSDDDLYDYYHKIITKANQDLAPFERIVNFALLNRDLDLSHDELTPKGTYRRKNIEANFRPIIDELYRSKHIEFQLGRIRIRVPRWFYRDLGILEDDIIVYDGGLYNRHHRRHLMIGETQHENIIRIGDLDYYALDKEFDLGSIVRQPLLWLGNPSLISFSPFKEGWHLSPKPFTGQVFLPSITEGTKRRQIISLCSVPDEYLGRINQLMMLALYSEKEAALIAIRRLGEELKETDDRVRKVIRRRLAALSNHDELKVRALAYRILLTDDPTPDYTRILPSFIHSGKPFLDEEAIQEIASSSINRRRLDSLRQRLFLYRSGLKWPADETTRRQFDGILKLLADFAKFHPEFYATIRAELASWILHREDPELSKIAENYFTELYRHYEDNLEKSSRKYGESDWERWLIFDDNLSSAEKEKIKKVLVGTTFLKQSIILAFDDDAFDLDQIPEGGIWVSRIVSRRRYLRYRICINTEKEKHFDLQLILHGDVKQGEVLETIYWLMSMANYPYGPRVVPRLGCCRPELGARSLVYRGELTLWEKVREYSSLYSEQRNTAGRNRWRKMFIRGISAIFKGWRISGKRILPGAISPEIIVVPEQDYREGAMILSLNDWKNYENPMVLIRPILRNFFLKTYAHYPWTREIIDVEWIFDACIEDLGLVDGKKFLIELENQLREKNSSGHEQQLYIKLISFLKRLEKEYYAPLPLLNAINRYLEWSEVNLEATSQAKEQIIYELWRLYRLNRYPEIARYYLYMHTYYDDAGVKTRAAFHDLIDYMHRHPDIPAIQSMQLTDLQATLDNDRDREVFGNLIFPKAHRLQKLEVLAVGSSDRKHVVVKSDITDRKGESFAVREPVTPVEIGQLYRIFFKEGYSKSITEGDRYLVVVDSTDQIVGGLCYRYDGEEVVHLDGSVISAPLMGRGIGSALLEDFCNRLTNQGIRVVKTHFFLRRYYSNRGFQVDKRWGALVRFLGGQEKENPNSEG